MSRSATESDLVAAVRSLLGTTTATAPAPAPVDASNDKHIQQNQIPIEKESTHTIDLDELLTRPDLRAFVKALVADTLDRSGLFEKSTDSSYRIVRPNCYLYQPFPSIN